MTQLKFAVVLSLTFFSIQSLADSRPLHKDACNLNHRELLEQFVDQEFNKLHDLGEIHPGDQLGSVTPHRQLSDSNNGDTLYELRLYGRTDEYNVIELDGDSGSPESTRDFRCYAKAIVTSDCQVIPAPMEFMDAEKLDQAAKDKLIEMERQAQKEGKRLEFDENGGISVQVAVPRYQRVTCDRTPPPLLF